MPLEQKTHHTAVVRVKTLFRHFDCEENTLHSVFSELFLRNRVYRPENTYQKQSCTPECLFFVLFLRNRVRRAEKTHQKRDCTRCVHLSCGMVCVTQKNSSPRDCMRQTTFSAFFMRNHANLAENTYIVRVKSCVLHFFCGIVWVSRRKHVLEIRLYARECLFFVLFLRNRVRLAENSSPSGCTRQTMVSELFGRNRVLHAKNTYAKHISQILSPF
jgi:hypothetical protein